MKRSVGRQTTDCGLWASDLRLRAADSGADLFAEVGRPRSEVLVKPEAHFYVDFDSYGLTIERGWLKAPRTYGSDRLLIQTHS